MPAMTSAASAICGTHLGDTKLVTSSSVRPASCRRCTRPIFTSAGTWPFSFCRPSRGPTSTSLTLDGSCMVFSGCFVCSVSALAIAHAGHGLSALAGADLAGDLGDAGLAVGAGRGVRREHDLRVAPERVVGRRRLLPQHVERGPRELAAVEQCGQVLFHEVAAPRDVDEIAAALQAPERAAIEDSLGLRRQ